jgi:hypothetical protein
MSDEKFLADNMVEAIKNLSNALDNYVSAYELGLENPTISMTDSQKSFYEMTSKKMSYDQLTQHIENIDKHVDWQ